MRIHTATSTGPELRKVYEAGSDGSIRLEAEEGFQRWNEFDTSHRDFDTLEQLRDVLEEMSHDPKTTIVLGAPLEARQGHSADEYNDYTYSLFFADVDSFDFDGTAEEAITELFPFLDGKEHVYYFSPSSGIKAGWRLRVIWRIRLTIEEQSEYAAFLNEQISLRKGLFRKWVDVSIYKRGGFIFTARPDLRGIDDPHPVRLSMLPETAHQKNLSFQMRWLSLKAALVVAVSQRFIGMGKAVVTTLFSTSCANTAMRTVGTSLPKPKAKNGSKCGWRCQLNTSA